MRRQDSRNSEIQLGTAAASASSYHGDPNAKTTGCMSGIICFLSKYHSTNFRKSKFLTFGKKQNQVKNNRPVGNGPSSPGSSTSMQVASSNRIMAKLAELNKTGDKSPTAEIRYLQAVSYNFVPRSPTLPAEIRRRTSAPLVIARLMGLEEAEAVPSKVQVQDQYYYSRITSGQQKRQQLLGALEKCDQDLKALKKMIEAVGAPRKRSMEAINNTVVITKGVKKRSCGGPILKKSDSELQPSCVSVLDDDSRIGSPFSNHHHHHYYTKKQALFNVHYGRAQQRKILAREEDYYLSYPPSIESSVAAFDEKKTNPDYDVIVEETTVDQVCRDIAWGEKREMGRIGLALQDHIYKTLIQELLAEMDYSKYTSHVCSLPFEACKRRLSF